MSAADTPTWLAPLIAAVDGITARDLSRIEAPT